MAPIFPFFAIFAAYLLVRLSKLDAGAIKNNFLRIACCVLLITNVGWTTIFFSIYLRHDIRVSATEWVKNNLPSESTIFTEQGNMIEAPMGGNFKKISLDFYGLEENPQTRNQIPEYLAQADYFIVQSRRLFSNHQRLPHLYPLTARFYDLLFSGALGFEKIKEFNSYPRPLITDETAEETWSVFDHPVVRIYKKIVPLSRETYEAILKI